MINPGIEIELSKFVGCVRHYSPNVFINKQYELIVVPSKNLYFRLEDVTNKTELIAKILNWLSRSATKGVSPYWQKLIRSIINEYLETDFDQDQFALIYEKLGNAINNDLTFRFIKSYYDLDLLEGE
ncbi:hypothetical protein [Brochothrix thermosphacta]|uniref:hypothetical protein n=1 Tax=Brochothrix thermosphacta TaxID=2756 RepID=UPI001FD140F0|nr:hypothetical protein [Brochothrix thermosphacta]